MPNFQLADSQAEEWQDFNCPETHSTRFEIAKEESTNGIITAHQTTLKKFTAFQQNS